MNTSQYMDKQIMDLSNSQNNIHYDGNNDSTDQNNDPPQEDHHHHHMDGGGGAGGDQRDEILPNYDFQPIRPPTSSQPSNFDSSNVSGTRVWSSAESKTNTGIRNYRAIDLGETATAPEKGRDCCDAALVSEIDRTMKKHADSLMHALEGVTARLSQLESRSRHLENSVDDLKASIGNHNGSTDGKLRQVENIVRGVQAGVQVLKDKQEVLEAHLQPPKPKAEPQSGSGSGSRTQTPAHMESMHQQQVRIPGPSHYQLPPAILTQPTSPNTPPPPAAQNSAAPSHYPNQFSQNLSFQPPEPPPQHYHLPPPQHQLQAAPPYQPPPPQIPQPGPIQPPVGEPAYLQSQNFPPMNRQPPSQQLYMNPYEPPVNRPGSGFSGQYGHTEPYSYGGGGGSPRKPHLQSSPSMGPSGASGGGSGYAQLPTARILPQAVPTGTSGVGGGNRVPIDDVVDKVTNMGFPREQVRAIVRKLTENGQAVDLNVVLDKVMTEGVENQGPRGWFGR